MQRSLLIAVISTGVVFCLLVLAVESAAEVAALTIGLSLILLAVWKLFAQCVELHGELVRLREVVSLNEYRAYHDALTNLKNRHFFDMMAEEISSPKYLPLSVILADVDGLKSVNDKLGHLAGDNLLIKVAQVLRASCRKDDIVVRWGGDEFAILLPRTDEHGCSVVQERIKRACEQYRVNGYHVSISLGAATKVCSQEDLQEVLQRADQELYKEKRIKKNAMKRKRAGS